MRQLKSTKNTNIPFVAESVPALVAIFFFHARFPAIACIPIIGRKRTNSITRPIKTFKNIKTKAGKDRIFTIHPRIQQFIRNRASEGKETVIITILYPLE